MDQSSNVIRNLICAILCCLTLSATAQELRYEDYVYLPHIKSVKFHHSSLVTSEPIVDLNSGGKLKLTFDDILGGDRDYTYRIIHCTKDWEPSDLTEMDYLDGFNDEEIEDYEYSIGTKYDYTNYYLSLPNEDLSWRISGNYLLIVTDAESEELALTRRFMVAENRISIGLTVDKARSARNILTHQEILLTIDNNRYSISNPQSELYVTLIQNGRWDNMITNIQPKFAIGSVINFDVTRRPSFPGFTTFRGIDLRSVNTRGFGVYSIDVYADEIDVTLETDGKRGNVLIQSFDDDLNGDYIIQTQDYVDGRDSLRGEYMNIYFTLKSDYKLLDADVYLVGEFTDWQPLEEYRLNYDPINQVYHTTTLLKQGYYDYQYMVQYDDGTQDCQYFEGSHFGTNNQYHALVYQRSIGKRYDRLIGVSTSQSTF